jgi:hypothetical protein
MGESSFSRLAPEQANVVVQLLEDELEAAKELLEDDKADFEAAREDLLAGMGKVGEAQLEGLQRRVGTLGATYKQQQQVVRDLRKNKWGLAKLQREKLAGGVGREAEARGGTDGSAPTPEKSEDAGLGDAAGAPLTPGPTGLQPIDCTDRLEDDGCAQNAEVLTPVLRVPSATAEARHETQDAERGIKAEGLTPATRQGAETGAGQMGPLQH